MRVMANGPTRRAFAGGAAASVVAAAAGCGRGERIAHIEDLAFGEAVAFRYPPNHAAFLVKVRGAAEGGVGEGHNVVAFHQACPHMGCPLPIKVRNLSTGSLGPCPCHRSTFDLHGAGRQIHGRATQNLVRVKLEIINGNIFPIGVEGHPFGEPIRFEE
jgi:arsenite oxidase small subunit